MRFKIVAGGMIPVLLIALLVVSQIGCGPVASSLNKLERSAPSLGREHGLNLSSRSTSGGANNESPDKDAAIIDLITLVMDGKDYLAALEKTRLKKLRIQTLTEPEIRSFVKFLSVKIASDLESVEATPVSKQNIYVLIQLRDGARGTKSCGLTSFTVDLKQSSVDGERVLAVSASSDAKTIQRVLDQLEQVTIIESEFPLDEISPTPILNPTGYPRSKEGSPCERR